jgi:hypothetical protein
LQDSGLYQWFKAKERHFPEEGEMGIIYFANFDLKRFVKENNRFIIVCCFSEGETKKLFFVEKWKSFFGLK